MIQDRDWIRGFLPFDVVAVFVSTMIQTIAHTTDFSPASSGAFAHALRLAMEFRAKLDLLHVKYPDQDEAWDSFPHVRQTLARWGVLPENATHYDLKNQVGISVRKVEVSRGDTVAGIIQFLLSHQPDLIVVQSASRRRTCNQEVTANAVTAEKQP